MFNNQGFRKKRYHNFRSRFNKTKKHKRTFNVVDFIKWQNKTANKDNSQDNGFITQVDFQDLGLHKDFSTHLRKVGFNNMTEVQEQAIPLILKGESLVAIAPTGTGKTGAFLIPSINRLLNSQKRVKILVITPTRELAIQVFKEIRKIAYKRLNLALIIGGESVRKQLYQLNKDVDIVVGTPGRLIDLTKQKALKLGMFNVVVIDEVDRLLDMGFIEDITFMLEHVQSDAQLLFFSATYDKKTAGLVSRFIKNKNYQTIRLTNNTPVGHIDQKVVCFSDEKDKFTKLLKVLNLPDVKKAIVFVNTKRYADKVYRFIRSKQIKVGIIHGDKSQFARNKAFNLLKQSRVKVLVATNVLARGIDITDVTHVINLDSPLNKDEYIHRIGRAGRFGRKGVAITFVPKSAC